jgi:hypothetical protein
LLSSLKRILVIESTNIYSLYPDFPIFPTDISGKNVYLEALDRLAGR